MYKIDKKVPIPEGRTKRSEIWPTLDKMNVGDSFEFPKAIRQPMAAQVQQYVMKYRNLGRKFSMRKVSENTCRLWRIE